MGHDTNWIDMDERRKRLSIHTNAPAKVIKFNEESLTADIELLFLVKYADGETEPYPIIEDVPVMGMRYRVRGTYTARVDGLIGVHGGVDGSGGLITPTQEIEYYPSLKPGDEVWVNFAERALDNWVGNTPFDPEYNRTHDIRDAVIVGLRLR